MGAAKSSFAEKGENCVNIDSSADSRLDLVDGEGISTASIQLYENPEDTSRTPNKIDKDFPIKEESNLRLTLPALGNETSEMDGDRAEELSKYAEEISPLTDHLFISGWRPAASLASLQAHKITRIVNCCASFAPNVFSDSLATPIRYLSLRLVDSKEEDILWFLPQVLHFIDEGARQQQNTLVHCEKGISRSCAFAIAYHMWRFRSSFQDSFSFVKSKRSICNPNAGFLCNLIEFQRFLCLDSVSPPPLLFRLARHSSFDTSTPVLKLAIDPSTRQVSLPSIGLLSSRGVFVVVPSRESTTRKIFIWKGSTLDNDDLVSIALDLARPFNPYLTSFEDTKVVCQGFECEEFLSCFVHSPQMLRTPAVDDDINGDLYTSSDQGSKT